MKTTNKILSIILATLMVVTIIPITASAAISGSCGENVTWELDKSTGTLTFSGSGEMRDYYSGNRVPWDYYVSSIKNVVINEGITTIVPHAFKGCYNLTSVTIPNSVTAISNFAFYECTKLTSITIPDGVRQIGEYAFYYCTKLTSITIPNSVVWIDRDAFAKCTSLTEVNYLGTLGEWYDIDVADGNGKLFDANITSFPSENFTWEFDEETATLTLTGTGEIPDYYYEDDWGGYYCGIRPWEDIIGNDVKHIVINEGITYIGAYAFAYSDSLETVTMSSVATIAYDAFYECVNLKTLTTSNSLKVIGDDAFYKCDKLTYIYYSGTQEEWNQVSIGDHWNDEMDYVKVYPSDYVVNSDYGTFQGITGGDTVSWTFDANTYTLTISGEGKMGVDFAKNLLAPIYKYVGFRPWENYKFDIKRVVISDGVTGVGMNNFRFFPNLTEVVISASVTEIDDSAFQTCDAITDVYYTGTEDQWNSITVGTYNDSLLNATIHYNYHTHNYESVVTAPTCTEQGYTTYTCECDDSYIDDYTDATGHNYESKVIEPSCTNVGYTAFTCACGDNYFKDLINATGHTPADAVEENYVAPTCENAGSKDLVVYCSVCDEEISRKTERIEILDHIDEDNDGYCDDCDEQICDHRCHKSGIAGFIWKILRFVNSIFGTNKYCECGVAHY